MENSKKSEQKDLNSLELQPSCQLFIKESYSGLKSQSYQQKIKQRNSSLKKQNGLHSFQSHIFQHQHMITTTQNQNKKQQSYILTENQMVQLKRDNSNEEKRRTNTCRAKEKRYIFTNWSYPRLCKQFCRKLKRNNQLIFHKAFQTEIQKLNENKLEIQNIQSNNFNKNIIYSIEKATQIFTFFLFSIGFPFISVYNNIFYIVIQLAVSLIIFLKIIVFYRNSNSQYHIHQYFSIKKFLINQYVSILTFIFSLISIILWFTSQFSILSYTNLISLIISFKLQLFHNILIHFILTKKISILFAQTNIIKIITNFFIFSHLLSCYLCLLILSNLSQNWLNRSFLIQNSREIYLWTFNEALSIFFSAGVIMPTPTNNNECTKFIIIRIIAFLFSLINLRLLLDYLSFFISKNTISQLKHLETVTLFCKNTEIKDKIYNQLTSLIQNEKNQEDQSFSLNLNQCKNWLSNNLTQKEYLYLMSKEVSILNQVLPALSKKMRLNLSKSIEYQFFSPNQIILDFDKTYDFLILVKGKIINTSKKSHIHFYNGLLQVGQNCEKNQLLNKSFLTNKFENYRIKCLSETVIGRIKQQSFRNCLKNNQFDSQYVFSERDKHFKFTDTDGTIFCRFCGGKHTLYTCPRFHYSPFKNKILYDHLNKHKIIQRKSIIYLNQRWIRVKSSSLKSYSIYFLNLKPQTIEEKYQQKYNRTTKFQTLFQAEISTTLQAKIQCLLQNKMTQMYQKIKSIQDESDQIWTLKCDKLHNYRYYFQNYNADNIGNIKPKKQQNPTE